MAKKIPATKDAQAASKAVAVGKLGKGRRMKRNRIQIHEVTLENDMKYRGPLSSRHFQIMGWACIVIAQLLMIATRVGGYDNTFGSKDRWLYEILQVLSGLSVPCLLIYNFTRILNASEGYGKQLIKNATAAAGLACLFCLLFYRYGEGSLRVFLEEETPGELSGLLQLSLAELLPNGFLNFNLFIDMTLCTLVMFFLNYRPKRFFQGKSRFIFRLGALLPIGYEAGCLALKILAAKKMLVLPPWSYSLLPVKPVMTFVLFIALAVFVKTRELWFRRHGKTHEDYQAFLRTRRNSWNFSVFIAVMMAVIGLLDCATVFIFPYAEEKSYSTTVREEIEAAIDDGLLIRKEREDGTVIYEISGEEGLTDDGKTLQFTAARLDSELESRLGSVRLKGYQVAEAVGIGDAGSLLLLAPVMLLFSYTRRPKNDLISMVIPLIAIAVLLLFVLEGIHQALIQLPITKIRPGELLGVLEPIIGLTGGSGP